MASDIAPTEQFNSAKRKHVRNKLGELSTKMDVAAFVISRALAKQGYPSKKSKMTLENDDKTVNSEFTKYFASAFSDAVNPKTIYADLTGKKISKKFLEKDKFAEEFAKEFEDFMVKFNDAFEEEDRARDQLKGVLSKMLIIAVALHTERNKIDSEIAMAMCNPVLLEPPDDDLNGAIDIFVKEGADTTYIIASAIMNRKNEANFGDLPIIAESDDEIKLQTRDYDLLGGDEGKSWWLYQQLLEYTDESIKSVNGFTPLFANVRKFPSSLFGVVPNLSTGFAFPMDNACGWSHIIRTMAHCLEPIDNEDTNSSDSLPQKADKGYLGHILRKIAATFPFKGEIENPLKTMSNAMATPYEIALYSKEPMRAVIEKCGELLYATEFFVGSLVDLSAPTPYHVALWGIINENPHLDQFQRPDIITQKNPNIPAMVDAAADVAHFIDNIDMEVLTRKVAMNMVDPNPKPAKSSKKRPRKASKKDKGRFDIKATSTDQYLQHSESTRLALRDFYGTVVQVLYNSGEKPSTISVQTAVLRRTVSVSGGNGETLLSNLKLDMMSTPRIVHLQYGVKSIDFTVYKNPDDAIFDTIKMITQVYISDDGPNIKSDAYQYGWRKNYSVVTHGIDDNNIKNETKEEKNENIVTLCPDNINAQPNSPQAEQFGGIVSKEVKGILNDPSVVGIVQFMDNIDTMVARLVMQSLSEEDIERVLNPPNKRGGKCPTGFHAFKKADEKRYPYSDFMAEKRDSRKRSASDTDAGPSTKKPRSAGARPFGIRFGEPEPVFANSKAINGVKELIKTQREAASTLMDKYGHTTGKGTPTMVGKTLSKTTMTSIQKIIGISKYGAPTMFAIMGDVTMAYHSLVCTIMIRANYAYSVVLEYMRPMQSDNVRYHRQSFVTPSTFAVNGDTALEIAEIPSSTRTKHKKPSTTSCHMTSGASFQDVLSAYARAGATQAPRKALSSGAPPSEMVSFAATDERTVWIDDGCEGGEPVTDVDTIKAYRLDRTHHPRPGTLHKVHDMAIFPKPHAVTEYKDATRFANQGSTPMHTIQRVYANAHKILNAKFGAAEYSRSALRVLVTYVRLDDAHISWAVSTDATGMAMVHPSDNVPMYIMHVTLRGSSGKWLTKEYPVCERVAVGLSALYMMRVTIGKYKALTDPCAYGGDIPVETDPSTSGSPTLCPDLLLSYVTMFEDAFEVVVT